MYLFVFLWVPSLQEASLSTAALPLGYIFSCFMVAMMLGSLLYTTVMSFSRSKSQASEITAQEDSLILHAKLSSFVCAASALCFAVTIACQKEEHMRFWAFCVFEACVGMYYPVQGMLRGALISDEHRATVSSVSPIPQQSLTSVRLAFVAVPRASKHLRSGVAPYRRFVGTRQGAHSKRVHAWSVIGHDR